MLKISFEINGRQVDSNDLAGALEQAILEGFREEIQSKLMGVRDPDTGEFPTVVVRGQDLDHLSLEVSGSEKIVALAKERLGITDDGSTSGRDEASLAKEASKKTPCVFLCHASEDKALVRKIAEDFLKHGIDAFLDEWEIGPGDSIRQKIDAGVANCTHFLVVLTPHSLAKPWVNAELDAGFIRKLEGRCKFVPLRYGLSLDDLPPLLKALYSPALTDYENDLKSLVGFIHEIAQKPPLGPAPEVVTQSSKGRMGISAAAEAIVRYMVEHSEHGLTMDPGLPPELVHETTGLHDDDIIDAVDELKSHGYVRLLRALGCGPLGFVLIGPEATLFAKFDRSFRDWDPEADALRIAADLVSESDGGLVSSLAEKYGWPPRRMNPAVAYLEERSLVDSSATLGVHPWARLWIRKNAATRRFVRDRS